MDKDPFPASIDGMCFKLRNVMRDIINDRQMHTVTAITKDALECATHCVTDALAIGPGKVCGRGHGVKISLPLRRMNGSACQLAVGKMKIVSTHRLV